MTTTTLKPYSAIVPAPAATTYINSESIFSLPPLEAKSALKNKKEVDERVFTSRLTTQAEDTIKRYRAVAPQEPSISLENLIGTWKCHRCSLRNQVVVIAGDHPLGILKCRTDGCGHIWCAECPASSAMQVWYVGEQEEVERLTKPFLGLTKPKTETTETASSHIARASEKESIFRAPKCKDVSLPYIYLCPSCGPIHRLSL
jgi:predicted RNA-binding Zn-ribbon protein involved in translation (DUF1610 family)